MVQHPLDNRLLAIGQQRTQRLDVTAILITTGKAYESCLAGQFRPDRIDVGDVADQGVMSVVPTRILQAGNDWQRA